jgi:hypothetical protein
MNDSRLEYEAPERIRYINAQDAGNSVWSPSLTFPTAPVTNSQEIILDDESNISILQRCSWGPRDRFNVVSESTDKSALYLE